MAKQHLEFVLPDLPTSYAAWGLNGDRGKHSPFPSFVPGSLMLHITLFLQGCCKRGSFLRDVGCPQETDLSEAETGAGMRWGLASSHPFPSLYILLYYLSDLLTSPPGLNSMKPTIPIVGPPHYLASLMACQHPTASTHLSTPPTLPLALWGFASGTWACATSTVRQLQGMDVFFLRQLLQTELIFSLHQTESNGFKASQLTPLHLDYGQPTLIMVMEHFLFWLDFFVLLPNITAGLHVWEEGKNGKTLSGY